MSSNLTVSTKNPECQKRSGFLLITFSRFIIHSSAHSGFWQVIRNREAVEVSALWTIEMMLRGIYRVALLQIAVNKLFTAIFL